MTHPTEEFLAACASAHEARLNEKTISAADVLATLRNEALKYRSNHWTLRGPVASFATALLGGDRQSCNEVSRAIESGLRGEE